MRYLFWFVCCAVFCGLLANKNGSAVGLGGAYGALVYGGINGLGVAKATSSRLFWGLPLRMLMAVIWTFAMAAVYIFVFTPLGHRLGNDTIFWGLLFALPAPIICVVRGIPMLWKKSRLPDSTSDST